MTSLHLVGECEWRIFGLLPGERLARQVAYFDGTLLVASHSAVLGDSAIEWLRTNPGKLLTTPRRTPLAIVVASADKQRAVQALSGDSSPYEQVVVEAGPDLFNKKLRRRERLFGMSLKEHSISEIERRLFDSVYKGVTDLVTKWAWPVPAFLVTRLFAALRIPPNAVTLASILLVFVVAYLFLRGDIWLGLALAWVMTFLDTVDGKLARVTASSSRLGDILDHRTDLLHPPLWWICLALGLHRASASEPWITAACGVIIVTYIIGRAVEKAFKKTLGFNQYVWQPFDSYFRLIVARRNPILLIMTIGLAAGAPANAYLACAAWSILSVLIQLVRLGQAFYVRPVQPWLAQ
jgi:phosphatidylglycerophosphate synthase